MTTTSLSAEPTRRDFLFVATGAVAAVAVGKAKLGLGIPGHSIVLAALPMMLGLALAPRRLAGSVMSAGALGSAWQWIEQTGVVLIGIANGFAQQGLVRRIHKGVWACKKGNKRLVNWVMASGGKSCPMPSMPNPP